MTRCIRTNKMVVVNRGNVPTFARNQQKPYIDVTVYTDTLYSNITETVIIKFRLEAKTKLIESGKF